VVRDCILEEYLPSELLSLLAEPSTMKDDHCHSILTFWYTRQINGMTPTFRFNKYLAKDELIEALPRERAEVQPTDIAPIPSGPNPGAKNRGQGRRARRKAKSSIIPGVNIIEDDESERNSNTVPRSTKPRKSRKDNKGKERARDMDSGTSSKSSTSSSDSESPSTTTTTTEEGTESDLEDTVSDQVGRQSRGRMEGIGSSRQANTQLLFTGETSIATTSQPTFEPSHINVEYVGQPYVDDGDEDLFPSQDLDLAPELQAIAKMLQAGIAGPEINARVLQAFSAMTVKSQSQSPLKRLSRGASTVTDLGKRRTRSSTEGLPPASPTKKTRVRSLDNSVEASPASSTANLHSLGTGHLFTEPGSFATSTTLTSSSHHQTFECDDTAPQASLSRITKSRGSQAQTIPRGNAKKAPRSKKQVAASSPRVTRSHSPKKRNTRSHPT